MANQKHQTWGRGAEQQDGGSKHAGPRRARRKRVDSSAAERKALELSSWFAVVRAYEVCVQQYAHMLENFDITTPQFDVLCAIQYLGSEALPKRIAERLVVSRPNITGLLRRLEARGLIETVPHATDGRSSICQLTAEGVECTAAVQGAAERFIQAQAAPFTDDELTAVESVMHRMRSHLVTLEPNVLARGAVKDPLEPSRRATNRSQGGEG